MQTSPRSRTAPALLAKRTAWAALFDRLAASSTCTQPAVVPMPDAATRARIDEEARYAGERFMRRATRY